MAEAALLGVAKSVLGQLGSSALKEGLLLWNAKKDLKRLEDSTSNIVNILHDAERREPREELVKGWLSRLRAVLYDIDDFFDVVAWTAERKKTMNGNAFRKEVRLFFSKSNQLGFIIKAAHDVKDLRERVEDIYKDITPFNFKIQPINENLNGLIHGREETHSFVQLGDVIGRGRERDEIIRLLLPDEEDTIGGGGDKNLSVVSVIGFGGMGKTTLAKFVYNDVTVKNGFDMCLWVCINYLSNLKEVLVAILTSILESKPDDSTVELLQKKLRECIEGKKYLLVMDDVWDENILNWSVKLKPLLRCGKSGSKVLVTTRNRLVAECFGSIKPYYELNVLSEGSAWELFKKMAFEGDVSADDSRQLESLGKEIVRKCGRVPLALVTIGRMLCSKDKHKMTWLSFLVKELPQVLSDDTPYDDNNIMKVLRFSYNDLPPALKHCFAYCSLFPKDYTFDKDELVRIWLAQGFLEARSEKSLEEVGDEYFFHLINRCFFQEVEMSKKEGCVSYSCKMHDLLHELAIQVAGMESICLLEKDSRDRIRRRTTLRHVSAMQCDSDFSLKDCGMSSHSKTIRTLMFNDVKLITESLNSFVTSFRMLRVLRLSSLEVEILPDSIGELIHLRYLDLSKNSRLEVLPDSVRKLHHLQTLILKNCESLKELPSSLGKLVSLRHLLLYGSNKLYSLPSSLAELASLVTLDQLIVHQRSGGLRYLGCLDNLCGTINIKLPVKGWSNCIEDARKSNMSRKHKLNGMVIGWSNCIEGANEVEEDHTKAMLEVFQPPTNIQYLSINWYSAADVLSTWFSSLSNLKQLNLVQCSVEYLDVSIRSGSSLFPCLEILEMSQLPNLRGWWREVVDNAPISELPVLPCVSNVLIKDCPNLVESMPLFVRVKTLKLDNVDEKWVSKLLNTPSKSCSFDCHHHNKLEVLRLRHMQNLECLPEGSIRHLACLRSLRILHCSNLRWVSHCGLGYLTSLEELELSFCENARLEDKGDEKAGETKNGLGMPWKALRSLRRVAVPWESHFQDGLQYLTLLEELEIRYSEDKQVKADNEDMEGRGLLWDGLKRLHTLNLSFDHIRCSFPKWIQYLRPVKHLALHRCEFKSMSWSVFANMQVQELDFEYAAVTDMIVDDSVAEQQRQFNSLVQLRIAFSEAEQWIHDIPWNLLSSLRILVLQNCKENSIPEGIQHLKSLQQLEIRGSHGIKAIPKWMTNLTSLQRLYIRDCSPVLEQRTQKVEQMSRLPEIFRPANGADWPLISHIPDVRISQRHEFD